MPTAISWSAMSINCGRKKAQVTIEFHNQPFNPAFADEVFTLVAAAPAMRDGLNDIITRYEAGDGPGLQQMINELKDMLVNAKLR
jgi:outer membrane lipoprotein-sorting protein